MSKWPVKSLKSRINVKHGYPFKSEFFSDIGDYIVLTPGNFHEEGGFKRQFGKEKFYTGEIPDDYLHEKGDLIVAMTEQAAGLLGSCAIVPESSVYLHNQRLGLITVDENEALKDYIYHLFKTSTVREQIRLTSSGSKVKHTSPERIYAIKVPLPPVEEQRKIIQILNLLDKKIELNNRINAELEAMAKTLYDYWFVQFDFPDTNGKPYKTSGGKMVYNAELKREIPEGWVVKKVGDYADVLKGDLITAKDTKEGDFKVVAAGVDFSYTHADFNRAKNTITISGSGANAGFINFWREPIFASDCITVRGATDTETLLLLHHLSFIQNHILNQATGSAQPHVYPSDIRILDYAIPKDFLIDDFGEFAIPMNNQIAKNSIENQLLVKLRDWLLPMLMNGQVTVR